MLERPASPPRVARAPRRTRRDVVGTLPVAAVTAALWAAAVGLVAIGVLVTIVWAVSARRGRRAASPPSPPSGVVWLVAHHAPVDTAAGTVTLLPMLLLALPLVLLQRGRALGRADHRRRPTARTPRCWWPRHDRLRRASPPSSRRARSLGGASVSPVRALLWSACSSRRSASTAGVADGAGLLVAGGRAPPGRGCAGRARRAGVAGTALAVAVGVVAWSPSWPAGRPRPRSRAPGLLRCGRRRRALLLCRSPTCPNLAAVDAVLRRRVPASPSAAAARCHAWSSAGALLPGIPLLGAVPPTRRAAAPLLLLPGAVRRRRLA